LKDRRIFPTIFSHMLAASLTFCIYGHKVLAEPHNHFAARG
jgi:hypothetical protein